MPNHNVAIGLLEHALSGPLSDAHAEQIIASLDRLRMTPPPPNPFSGTPNNWWERAERVTLAESENRSLGNWYIIRQRTAGKDIHSYRLMTPSRPPQTDKLMKAKEKGLDRITAEGVRILIRGESAVPAWMNSAMVIADFERDQPHGAPPVIERLPWVRKNGRWHAVYDGRRSINDHTMAELNPVPATIQEV